VYSVDADGANAVNLADGSGPVWSPDGTKIAFTVTLSAGLGAYGHVYVMNADGTGLRKIGEWSLSDAIGPCPSGRPYAWSPDGRFVAYWTDGYYPGDPRAVMLAPADGSAEPQPLVPGAGDWSPDGKRFVYSGLERTSTDCQIYLTDLPATGEPQWLTQGRHPVWSPDGQWIAFITAESQPMGPGEVRVINVTGNGERKVMDISGYANMLPLAWSPDGTRLAAAGDGLFVVDLASGEKRRLAEDASFKPAWSPDGTQLAFTVWENDGYSVYVVDADGSGQPRKLADGSFASWSPDGKRIAFGG
jgi:Tol biopolymer transport system component